MTYQAIWLKAPCVVWTLCFQEHHAESTCGRQYSRQAEESNTNKLINNRRKMLEIQIVFEASFVLFNDISSQ